MNKTEIIKAICEIENTQFHALCEMEGSQLNPLTDDAMSFALMIKHKVNISHSDGAFSQATIYAPGTTDDDEPLACVEFFNDDCSYNEAICVAIIEANNKLKGATIDES